MADSRPWDLSIWAEAGRFGQPVNGFIPLKSPVAEDGADEEDIWTVSLFMERQASLRRPVGLCIDLTSEQSQSRRLYEPAEWTDDWDVKYVSIPCAPPLAEGGSRAGGSDDKPAPLWVEHLPPESAVEEFIKVVDEFWAKQQRFIAVHCITGINVTGYMIARYLMRACPVNIALEKFAASRPPGVYAAELVDELWRVASAAEASRPARGAPIPRPTPPAWHAIPVPPPMSGGGGGGGGSSSDGGGGGGKPAVPLFSEAGTKRRAGADDAPSSSAPPPKQPKVAANEAAASDSKLKNVATALPAVAAERLLARCQQLALPPEALAAGEPPPSLWCDGEPLDARRLEAVSPPSSLCTWMAEGERVLLVVTPAAAGGFSSALLDRRGGAWQLGAMQWPRSAEGGLVIVGEVVCDVTDTDAVWRLLAYDLLALGGRSVASSPLHKRLALLNAEVIAPRKQFDLSRDKLRVRAKDCFKLKHVPYLLTAFPKQLSHACHGVLLLDSDAPYAFGRTDKVLEWRSASASVTRPELIERAQKWQQP